MKTPAQIRAFLSDTSVRSNPTPKKRKPSVTVKKAKGGGFTFCRTVSKTETKRMAKVFDKVRTNPTNHHLKAQALNQYAMARKSYLLGGLSMGDTMRVGDMAKAYGATPADLAVVDKRLSKMRDNPRCCTIDGRLRHKAMHHRKTRKNPHFPGRLGSGSRFAACEQKVSSFYAKKGRKVNAGAVCASIGRRAYGPKKFKKLAIAGKRRRR